MNLIRSYSIVILLALTLNSFNAVSDDSVDSLKSKVGTSIEDIIENSILNSFENTNN